MKILARFIGVLAALALLVGGVQRSHAQILTSGTSNAAGYVRVQPVNVQAVTPFTPGTVLVMPPNGVSPFAVANSANAGQSNSASPNAASTNAQANGGNITGLVTIPTFTGAFAAQSGLSLGNVFPFVMMGNDPLTGGTTNIPTKITEVSLQLLNADGSVFTTVPFAPFEDATTDSPNFANAMYNSSGPRTQFADAIQRAEFFNTMKPNWHTELQPAIVNRVTITVPFFVNVQLANGNIIQARSYFTGTASDGSTFVLMLNLLFNFFYDNAVVNDINANNFTTDAVNVDMFPNTFLFSLNVNNPNVPGGCCVLGFHTYFFEGGVTPQPRWISLFASFISPGLFGAGFDDVTALSHEISESFNDPFINNVVPSWQFPGQPPNSTVCQGNLETGDPVEVLSTATIPLTLKEKHEIFTFHPQNEALLQWFEMGTTSNAIDGAFSYPNETVLPNSAVPCP
ncbi:MAG TPA: hypothetical protein VKT50_04640 [Candidatus Acidoferrales bacterium]|nr:hypothetical protein [Candidatus Acidoferrales bacterium]